MEYLVIDTESCTGKSDDGSLCSIGYVIADESLNILEKSDILVNPLPKRFAVGNKKNLKRTGVMFAYTEDEFRQAPSFNERYHIIKDLFDNRLVLGFAMANDVKYLNDACDKYELPRIEYEYMDVQFAYKLLNPEENSIGLKTLSVKYGINYHEHRSDEDAAVSLLVLKSILDEHQMKYDDFIKDYKIVYGVNNKIGHHPPYSVAEFRGEKGLSVSHRLKNFIYSDYLNRLPKKRTGEVYCFAYALERKNPDLLRTIIDSIYKRGNSFTRDADICTVYVKENNATDDSRLNALKLNNKRLKKIVTFNELTTELGILSPCKYDDTDFLISLHEKLIK